MSDDDLIGPAPLLRFGGESDLDSDSDDGFAGPALPPGYKRGEPSSSSDESEPEVSVKRAKTGHSAGDGPAQAEKTKTKDVVDDDDFFGPALPPGFKKTQSSPERLPLLGPALPPGFRRAAYDKDEKDDDGGDGEGPALPPGYQAQPSSSEGEEEEVIGPMPTKGPISDSVAQDFERRAQRMKDKLTGDDTPEIVSRETWMTELPPELQHIGLGARTFKKKSGPENKDRTMWTDTPADRERKARERIEKKEKGEEEEKDSVPQVPQKDLEMAETVSKYNESKRAESLMTLHSKKMKAKAKEKADVPVERRPFDRDEDLQVNRFDEAQKQRLLKKSQELNTRFSHSKDRMFL
ncbi:GPALPP motifs-containing protein 1 [Hippoglossus hippoglossus]|uniref:GPALPP motifs-containing protein 1 n=1 Tax=Hippoglossus hippoglossus TaxID=8267 RepID=UPI00148C9B33|nr:GPALPP motifs-containing protein 1 [Hippoglossus hippoglossus]XP_035012236.1 GPALPP motifs-containing protein 1 [Hippoglossus stenolepis]